MASDCPAPNVCTATSAASSANGDQLGEPADPRVAEHGPGHDQPGQLERVTSGGRHKHRHPDPGHGTSGCAESGCGEPGCGEISAPASAAVAARITGTPVGRNGVVARAIAAPVSPTARSVLPARSRGQISARNAACLTTSMPSDCGEPSCPRRTRQQRGEIPGQVDGDERGEEAEPGRRRVGLRQRDGGGLVDDALGGDQLGGSPAAAAGRPGAGRRARSCCRAEWRRDPADQPRAAGHGSGQGELRRSVKARRLNTQACATFIPEPTAAAPKATPETPTANPSAMPSRTGRTRPPRRPVSDISHICEARWRAPPGLERSCRPPGTADRSVAARPPPA